MRWWLLMCVCAGCSGASQSTNNYAAAGVTAGIAVAAAAINRAATDECWGSCSNGYVCDRAEGVCVPAGELKVPPADPPDAEDDGCIEEDDGAIVCPDDPEADVTSEVEPIDDTSEVAPID